MQASTRVIVTAAAAAAAAVAAVVASSTAVHALPAPPSALPLLRVGDDDVEVSPYRAAPFAPLNATSYSGTVPSTGRPFTAHLGVVQNADLFSIEIIPGGCANHAATSVQAAFFGCQLATNGGYFAFTPPACEYNLIVNHTVVASSANGNVALGMSSALGAVVLGYIADTNFTAYGFRSLLSGAGFLVRAGRSYVNESTEFGPKPWNDTFVTEKAPRTAIGVTADGSLFSMVVDGVETEDIGLDLYEFADVLIAAGALHAVNIDGGGSSDAVLNGRVWSRPTCEDTPSPICERNVTSITCIAYS